MTELQKLLAQLTTRLLALLALLGPFAFAALLKVQSGTPSDALFGAWVHTSGFAVSLVILGFAGSWGFPIIAGVLAGDLFSSEDRYGTWKTILTRSCTREEVFAGKVLAVGTLVDRRCRCCSPSRACSPAPCSSALHALVNLSGQLTSQRAHAGADGRQLDLLPAAGARLHERRDPGLGRDPQRHPRRARAADASRSSRSCST